VIGRFVPAFDTKSDFQKNLTLFLKKKFDLPGSARKRSPGQIRFPKMIILTELFKGLIYTLGRAFLGLSVQPKSVPFTPIFCYLPQNTADHPSFK